jgi:hypothetical protein
MKRPHYKIGDTIICLYDNRKYEYQAHLELTRSGDDLWLASDKVNILIYDGSEKCWATRFITRTTLKEELINLSLRQQNQLKELEQTNNRIKEITERLLKNEKA